MSLTTKDKVYANLTKNSLSERVRSLTKNKIIVEKRIPVKKILKLKKSKSFDINTFKSYAARKFAVNSNKP